MDKKDEVVYINLRIPVKWKSQLKALAKGRSKLIGFHVTASDLIRASIREQFHLTGDYPRGVKVDPVFTKSVWSDLVWELIGSSLRINRI